MSELLSYIRLSETQTPNEKETEMTTEPCNGCGSQVWSSKLSHYMLCRKCEAISKRSGKIPTAGWSETLKDRPKKMAKS